MGNGERTEGIPRITECDLTDNKSNADLYVGLTSFMSRKERNHEVDS